MMRLMTWGALFVLSLIWSTVASGKELSPRAIYEQASPAVVMVMGYADGGRKGSGGTGSIIQLDGLVLTNVHVVIEEQTGKPFARLSVFLKPARVTGESKSDLSHMVRAKVVAYSQLLDLALLKLDGVTEPLPVVDVSESGRARIGDRVVAIGHPKQGGLWTLTTGVINAEVDNFNGVRGKQVFQTETGLNRGNSGGPLLDGEGRMIGVNTAIARVASDGLPITSISFSPSRASPHNGCGSRAWECDLDEGCRCPLDKCSPRPTNRWPHQFSPKPNQSSLLSLICRSSRR